jgi:ABC-type transport system involved in multi-copper enzyme maturation permease subunit
MKEELAKIEQFKTIKNIKQLGLLKIKLYYKKINTLVLLSIFFIIVLTINIVGLILIKSTTSENLLTNINTLVLVLSVLLFIVTMYITIQIFKEEISHNVHSLELRYGYKAKELFLSRIFSSGIIVLSFYLILLIINLSFGLPENNLMSIFAYRLYISSMA